MRSSAGTFRHFARGESLEGLVDPALGYRWPPDRAVGTAAVSAVSLGRRTGGARPAARRDRTALDGVTGTEQVNQ